MKKKEIIEAFSKGITLVWNDPDPIEDNDYTIKIISSIDEEMVGIQYGTPTFFPEQGIFGYSFAEVPPSEISPKIEKTYWLFGQDAVNLYNERKEVRGEISKKDVNKMVMIYGGFVDIIDSNTHPADALNMGNGAFDWIEISEKEYNLFD